jgi:hypothetical protein
MRTTDEPRRCRIFLIGDDHEIGLAFQDRPDELLDVCAVVLVVGVRVDDDVRAALQARFEAEHEGLGEAAVVAEAHDVLHAVLAGHGDGFVPAAVVDDEHFDRIDARDRFWQIGQRDGQRLRLVEAGNLDDELHGSQVAAQATQIIA